MSWSVEVLDRNSGRFLNSPESCTPLSLGWDDFLGPDKALIRCPCDHLSLEDWRTRLGQDVRVYDPLGRLAWWGYLEQVSQANEELRRTVGMGGVANRVAVRFRDLGGAEPDEVSQTTWVEDLESQSVYGIKEAVYQVGYTFRSNAELTAAMRLKEQAWPVVKIGSHVPGIMDTPGACLLECRGWMQTLSWRVWPGLHAVVANSPAQQGIQPVGNALVNQRVAQSFRVKDSLQFNDLAIRARKQGNPTDSLRFSLQTDLNGKPSGVELSAQSVTPGVLSGESYGWVGVKLSIPVSLQVGVPYWLILDRSGAIDSGNYYLLGLDENQGYKDGTLLIYDQSNATWKSRLPGADLLFRLTGVLEQVEQMRQVVDHGGQFLKLFVAEIGGSQLLPPLCEDGQDCFQVFRTLMRYGNTALEPLCAGIDSNRNVNVWKRPDAASATLGLSSEGRLQTRFGQPLEAAWQAVGQWLLSENARPLYLSSLTLEPITEKVSLNDR